MSRAIFSAPSFIFAIVLVWVAAAIATIWSFDPKVLEPSSFTESTTNASRFAAKAGYAPLAESEGPELRVHIDVFNYFDGIRGFSGKPEEILFVIKSDGAAAYRASAGINLQRHAITATGRAPASYATAMLASIDDLSSYDGEWFNCEGWHANSYVVEGVNLGRMFQFKVSGGCSGNSPDPDRPPEVVLELLRELNAVDI